MIEVGLGFMKIPRCEFWRMSLKEFKLAQRGFFEKMKQDKQTEWEIGRYIAFNSLVPHAKKGRLNSPQDLGRFDWEKDSKEVKYLSTEELRYLSLKHGLYKDKDGNGYNA